MTRAGIYCRISDDREGLEHGVDSQRADCLALCDRDGLTVCDVYVDNDLSASTKARKGRPEYGRLLADARAGRISIIVALSSARLTRAPREHEDQIDLGQHHGVRYLFVKSPSFDLNTADGRQIARMLAATDAAEAERTAERVRRDVQRRVRTSEPHGGPRGYGIATGGRELVLEEADRIREWAGHILAGGKLDTLATRLNKAGHLTPGGKAWKPWVIRRILLAPRTAGLRVHEGAEYQAATPAIIEPDVWRAVVRLLTDPRRRTHDQGTARRHLGTGLYWCDRCDRTVRATYHATGRRLYRCDCYRTWRADLLDQFVLDTVEAGLMDENRLGRLLPRQRVAGPSLAALRTEAAVIGQNIKGMAADLGRARSGVTLAALRDGIREGEDRLVEIGQILDVATRADGLAAVVTADDPVATFRALDDLARRQAVVRGLMEIRLGPPVRGRAKWAPEKFLGASRWVGDDKTWGDHWR